MESLERIIRAEIETKGPISFERFMELALYHPVYGYYMRERMPWERAGDYITAPQLTAIFGELISLQLREFWELMGRKRDFFVVEIGPGDGKLARDILLFLREHDAQFFNSIRYVLVEKNEHFRQIQKKNLEIFPNVSFFKEISELEEFEGVFLTNEVFDSLPVRILKIDEEVKEIYVGLENGDFVEVPHEASKEVVEYLKMLSVPKRRNFRTELCLRMADLIREISGKLKSGFMLTVDYGLTSKEYFMPERRKGTLLCYFRHRFHENPFINVGDQDITSHVNFSLYKIFCEDSGLRTVGFCPLGTFLVSLGLVDVLRLRGESLSAEELMKIKAVITPYGFGENHRVIVNSKGVYPSELKGFKLKNMVQAL